MIAETELVIVCDGGMCTGTAFYIVTVHAPDEDMYRLYCSQCTAELLQRTAKLLQDNSDDRPIGDYVKADPLLTGAIV